MWFSSQSVSFKRINSIQILAVAQIPLEMEFLVTTTVAGSFLSMILAIVRLPITPNRSSLRFVPACPGLSIYENIRTEVVEITRFDRHTEQASVRAVMAQEKYSEWMR